MEEKRLNEVVKIISNRMLSSVYQPIVSLKDGSVHAYEALSRITYEDAAINIAELFESAGQLGYLWELEKICRTNALKYAAGKPDGVKLFINVDGNVLRDNKFQKGFTKEKLSKCSLKIEDVVFEITERSNFDDQDLVHDIIEHYREQGYEVALDDLGSGYSGLNRLQSIKPGYVKIDYELIHDIHKDKSKKSLVRMLAGHCSDMDYKLIAEGIENEDELKCLIHLGVEYGQGFFLGKPKVSFENIDKAVVKLIGEIQKKNKDNHHKIGNIGKMGTVLYPTCSIDHAIDLFCHNKNLSSIGIVDSKCKFYGLIYRENVMNYLTDNKSMKKTVEDIMDQNVLVIDAGKTIKETIGKLMVRDESEFYNPFVILRKDRYFGIATVRDVLIAAGKEL